MLGERPAQALRPDPTESDRSVLPQLTKRAGTGPAHAALRRRVRLPEAPWRRRAVSRRRSCSQIIASEAPSRTRPCGVRKWCQTAREAARHPVRSWWRRRESNSDELVANGRESSRTVTKTTSRGVGSRRNTTCDCETITRRSGVLVDLVEHIE